jgi:hypothetical protein
LEEFQARRVVEQAQIRAINSFLGDTILGAERDLGVRALLSLLSAISQPLISQTDVAATCVDMPMAGSARICAARCAGKLPRPEP